MGLWDDGFGGCEKLRVGGGGKEIGGLRVAGVDMCGLFTFNQ